jgi:hypothetical protein
MYALCLKYPDVILLEQLPTGLCEDSHFTAQILFSLSLRKELGDFSRVSDCRDKLILS